ncbi:DUF2341 domain-containing protein, partial [candidate division WOR-3 bacterium]|nr:DUF2341 domain-containing protein [candidate division WOR-3 bacterium]
MRINKILYLITFLLIVLVSSGYSGGWYFPEWLYRRPVIVYNTKNSDTLTDYQVRIDLPYYSNMNSDFSDIRFTDSYGVIPIHHWFQTYTLSESAKVWVKVPWIPASDTTIIYMYYGNPDAKDESNFDSTFTKNYGESGLVGLWHMDKGSGNTITDSSGQNNTGFLYPNPPGDAPQWQVDDGGQWDNRNDVKFSWGSCLDFDGVNDYVEVPPSPSLDLPFEFTVEAWFLVNSFGKTPAWGGIVDKGTAWDRNYGIYITVNGNISYFTHNSGGEICVEYPASIDTNKWYHVGITANGSLLRGYLNGNFVDSITAGGPYTTYDTVPVSMGRRKYYSDLHLNGKIDEVRIYNRALCLNELKCHYERRKYTDPEPTVYIGEEETNFYISIEPDQVDSTEPGITKDYELIVINNTYTDDIVNIWSSNTRADWKIELCDSSGDTLCDHNGDGIVDTDTLESNDTTLITVKITPSPYA